MKTILRKLTPFCAVIFAGMIVADTAFAFQLFPGELSSSQDFRGFIVSFYRFALPASVLVAVLLIMIAGVIWVTSAGNPSRIETAKEYILNAIIGVVLLMSAYVMLGFINPNLVVLSLPQLKKITSPGCCLSSSSTTLVLSKQSCDGMNGTFVAGKSCEEVSLDKARAQSERDAKRIDRLQNLCTNYGRPHKLECLFTAIRRRVYCSTFCKGLVPGSCRPSHAEADVTCSDELFDCTCVFDPGS